ncbi:hypothetical protein [uncultured Aquimarina sp.]|uniref:hypothetical protein n=1 Tax=uncultured Aquimarina sp. TaxID=575652 RepID=UPI002609C90F|nr:hypothetical protein [uncultured Aquimarina sp.]
MKNLIFNLFVVSAVATSIISCQRDEINSFGEISEADAVEIIEQVIVSDSYGMDIQAEDAVNTESSMTSKNNICGVLNEVSTTRNSIPGAIIYFTHSIDYSFELICEGNIPQAYDIDFRGNGQYISPRLESEDIITYRANLSNLLPADGPYIYNSSFTREGDQILKINGNRKEFNSTLSIASSQILIDKTTRIILGGSATFSLTGNLTNGDTFSYNGSITFLGNGNATIKIGDTIYNVSL